MLNFFMLENSHTIEMSNSFGYFFRLKPHCVDEFEHDTDLGSPLRGCQPIKQLIFLENCMKIKKIGPREASKICVCVCHWEQRGGNTTAKQK